VHSPPIQISHYISGVTESKFTKCLPDVEITGGFNATIYVAILPSTVERSSAHSQNEEGVCQFSPTRATNRLP